MQPAIRDYYRLEEIWGGKSVRMKIDGEAGPVPVKPLPVGPVAGRRAAPARGGSTRTGAGKKPAPAKRSAPAKKPAPAKMMSAGVRKTARKGATRTR